MITIVVAVFIIGYLFVMLEGPLKVDKTASALLMAAICWSIVSLGHLTVLDHFSHTKTTEHIVLLELVGTIAEILIFLIGAMAIVELVDSHRGFLVITNRITATQKSTMLWAVCFLAFMLSAILDNLTCTIVMVSLLRRLVPVKAERMYFVSLTVIAANAGGAWSPIGDVTTTTLWIADKVSTQALLLTILIPSVVCVTVPAFLMSKMAYMKGEITIPEGFKVEGEEEEVKGGRLMLFLGIFSLLFVPIFKTITHLPPYLGMMFCVGVLWIVSEFIHLKEDDQTKEAYSMPHALTKIDMVSILFFLGILLSIGCLEALGILKSLAEWLDVYFATETASGTLDRSIVMILFGLASSIIDNLSLVVAAIGMYSSPDILIDNPLWLFLAYTAGTGGSSLIIGSAAGVAAMGMEKIDFMWYLKFITGITLLGFFAGCATFLLLYPLVQNLF